MPELKDALKSDDHRAALEELRDLLADSLRSADDNVRAQIAAQYRNTIAELAALPNREKSEADELVERRKARRAGTDAKQRAKQRRGSKPGA
jgi:hypothetical protein